MGVIVCRALIMPGEVAIGGKSLSPNTTNVSDFIAEVRPKAHGSKGFRAQQVL